MSDVPNANPKRKALYRKLKRKALYRKLKRKALYRNFQHKALYRNLGTSLVQVSLTFLITRSSTKMDRGDRHRQSNRTLMRAGCSD